MLNPLCDYRQMLSVAKIGKVFKVKPGHKIWVVGTMNPNYSGTYSLNLDMQNRWGFVEVGYMNEDKEKELLLGEFTTPATATEKQLVDRLYSLASLSRTKQMGEYAISTRDLVYFIQDYEIMGTAQALRMLEGKYEADAVKDFRTQCMSLFKVDLNGVELIKHG